MTLFSRICLILVLPVLLFVSSTQRPVHIFMAGDSTMADKPLFKTIVDSISGERVREPFPEMGWGQVLPYFFSDGIKVVNEAQNGRSTRTFMAEGRWQKITDNLRNGDFVVIQFGHNDESVKKTATYTPPEDYRAYLEKMVDETRAHGATPILCTPVARRWFDGDGNLREMHGVYPDIVREVAHAKNAYMVDMYALSRTLLEKAGADGSVAMFMNIPAGENRNFTNGLTDNTHFRITGAIAMAELFVNGITELHIRELTKELK